MNEKIEIPISKSAIFIFLILCLGFIGLGVLFILKPEQFQSYVFGNPTFIRIAGIASVLFFSICMVVLVKRLFGDKIGLTIDQEGIIDNSRSISVGRIRWEDIEGIQTLKIGSNRMLMLLVNNPDHYIELGKSGIAKKLMKSNFKNYGSPITITTNALKINHDQLAELIMKKLEERSN